ncbi:MAG: DUF374 domain-containing protein [Candidatus Eisenbacteria bacterium]
MGSRSSGQERTAPHRDESPYDGQARYRWAGRIGALVIRVLGGSWRLRAEMSPEARRLEEEGQPVLYAFWHQHLLPLTYSHRNRGVIVLVSRSADGEYISQVLHRLGCGTVRGSSSRGPSAACFAWRVSRRPGARSRSRRTDRGPAPALAGRRAAIAARGGTPIVPLATAASRCWKLRSWDRFEIPQPFSRLVVLTGDPIRIPSDASGRELEAEWGPRVQHALDTLERRAETIAAGAEIG